MLKTGDVVYFKEAKQGLGKKDGRAQFRGHGFGIMLGQVPPFQKAPPVDHLFRIMGSIGFIMLDDLASFIGDEATQKIIKQWEEKYYKKEETAAQEEAPVAEPSNLLDMNGSRIEPEPAP